MKIFYHLSRLPGYWRVLGLGRELRKVGLMRNARVSVVGASGDLVIWNSFLRLGLLEVSAFEPSAVDYANILLQKIFKAVCELPAHVRGTREWLNPFK